MVLWLHHASLPHSYINKMVPSFHLGNLSNMTLVNRYLPHAWLTTDTWSNTPSEGMVFKFRLGSILYIFIYVMFYKKKLNVSVISTLNMEGITNPLTPRNVYHLWNQCIESFPLYHYKNQCTLLFFVILLLKPMWLLDMS
jgi:hypothetical protein